VLKIIYHYVENVIIQNKFLELSLKHLLKVFKLNFFYLIKYGLYSFTRKKETWKKIKKRT